eukprot:g41474.t1
MKDQAGMLRVKLQNVGGVLKEYFSSVFTLEKEKLDMEFRKRDCEELAKFVIGNGEILEALSGLKTEKSPGPGELHPRLLSVA